MKAVYQIDMVALNAFQNVVAQAQGIFMAYAEILQEDYQRKSCAEMVEKLDAAHKILIDAKKFAFVDEK